ncbi:polyribonucleotide nucleotidyltransferase [Candidatus Daviesbacteria bacterium]|nr:polyribonucleotide nucleotidyltransferase [Candidatus Daviesbacteria bacterium]
MEKIVKELDLVGKKLSLETGRFVKHANGSVLARIGDTVVLATVVMSVPRQDLDYFPLSVDYEERLYAGGRISSSKFIKRENRPSEAAILAGRLIDRSIRPLFPKDLNNEVQVITTVLSFDGANDADMVALLGVSAALAISDIPWKGPISAVRVGLVEGAYIFYPTRQELANSQLDLVVSGGKDGVVMVEAGARELAEQETITAITQGQEFNLKLVSFIEDFVKEAGKSKAAYTTKTLDPEQEKAVRDYIEKEFIPQLSDPEVAQDEQFAPMCYQKLEEVFSETIAKGQLVHLLDDCVKKFIRKQILEKGKRIDGRKNNQIRPLTIEVEVLPRTHGSAHFKRGDTQILTIVTLGSPSLEQLIEGMRGEETKRYMHHYNFPPFATGEVKRIGTTGRREIGHGALAERALIPVLPPEEKFPYAIRVVSEVLTSAGSTSMGSVCGSTLALMDAGVPITAPVAGIAMGLVTDAASDKYVVLTDIAYAEDAGGDMDFKVAGTEKGITALQMDVKLTGIPAKVLAQAIAEAREGRMFILGKMKEALPEIRGEVSPHAPRIQMISIDPAKIGQVIGSGGKTINQIIATTGVAIDIEDDGKITITSKDQTAAQKAIGIIEGLTHEVKPGEIYEGEVKRIMTFGAFVEILPSKEGLVHISQLSPVRVERVEDVVQIGQKVRVRVTEIDPQGRINLSMKFGQDAEDNPRRDDHRSIIRGDYSGERFRRKRF